MKKQEVLINYENVYNTLYKWIEGQSFVGYDPYDALNTKSNIIIKPKTVRLILCYLNKFSPINLRKIYKIRAIKNNKALALICLSIMRRPIKKNMNHVLRDHINYILSKSLIERYGFHCWNAHNFPIQTTKEYQQAEMPGIIGTEMCASAIFEYYKKIEKLTHLKKVLLSTRDFFLKKLLVKNGNATYFKYKPLTSDDECIFNASLIAAKYVAKINKYFNSSDGFDIVQDCFHYIISKQNKNGSWHYGINLKTEYQKKQVDFHQGFILDCILDYMKLVDVNPIILESYRKGLSFYHRKQFDTAGRSLYRYPRKFPIDIHNQAQGIITFAKAGKYDERYINFAKTITNWTIQNMRSEKGYFFYQKYPFMTNKIPYMRWAQAWMLYALSHMTVKGNLKERDDAGDLGPSIEKFDRVSEVVLDAKIRNL